MVGGPVSPGKLWLLELALRIISSNVRLHNLIIHFQSQSPEACSFDVNGAGPYRIYFIHTQMPKALYQCMHPKACYTLYYYYVSVKVKLYNMTHIYIFHSMISKSHTMNLEAQKKNLAQVPKIPTEKIRIILTWAERKRKREREREREGQVLNMYELFCLLMHCVICMISLFIRVSLVRLFQRLSVWTKISKTSKIFSSFWVYSEVCFVTVMEKYGTDNPTKDAWNAVVWPSANRFRYCVPLSRTVTPSVYASLSVLGMYTVY